MPPYGRDAGMTQREAQTLAERVSSHAIGSTSVEQEGRYFVVTVEIPNGRYTLRDEADWAWLRQQVQRG